MKPIRNAVKCLLIENERIVITKYLKGIKTGYYEELIQKYMLKN